MDTPFFVNLWEKIKALVKSRKFWAAVGSSIAIITTDGATAAQVINGLVMIWSVYIGASAVEDGLRGR